MFVLDGHTVDLVQIEFRIIGLSVAWHPGPGRAEGQEDIWDRSSVCPQNQVEKQGPS
jgi:hypothetical protein